MLRLRPQIPSIRSLWMSFSVCVCGKGMRASIYAEQLPLKEINGGTRHFWKVKSLFYRQKDQETIRTFCVELCRFYFHYSSKKFKLLLS